jgi:hypothetical protein
MTRSAQSSSSAQGPRGCLRLTPTVLASGGALRVDMLKNSRARTVPLVDELEALGWVARRRRRSVSNHCVFTTGARRRRHSGWELALIRRSFSGCWGVLPLP